MLRISVKLLVLSALFTIMFGCGLEEEPSDDQSEIQIGMAEQAVLDSAHTRVIQECSQAMSGSWWTYNASNWPAGTTTFGWYAYISSDLGAWSRLLDNTYGYNKNGLRITSQLIGFEYGGNEIVRIPEDSKNTDHYMYIEIYDNGKFPLRIVFPVFDEGIEVQIVNDKYIVLQIIDERGSTHSGYVVNRQTRKITHYFSDGLGAYLTMTGNAQKTIVYNYEKKQIIVADSQFKEIQHLVLSDDLVGIFSGAAISPDDSKVAFFSFNGHNENPVYHVIVYNIVSNTAKEIGILTNPGQVVWRDSNSFVNMTQKIVNNEYETEEKEKFVVN